MDLGISALPVPSWAKVSASKRHEVEVRGHPFTQLPGERPGFGVIIAYEPMAQQQSR